MKKVVLVLVLAMTAYSQPSPCDLNQDSEFDIFDYQMILDMALGLTSCTASINGANVCDINTIQRIINAAFGQGCLVDVPAPAPHVVTLSWTHSTTPTVMNYKIYRGNSSGGPYTLLATVDYVTTYEDEAVEAGATYYYVVTALDSDGNQSVNSNEAVATVPTP